MPRSRVFVSMRSSIACIASVDWECDVFLVKAQQNMLHEWHPVHGVAFGAILYSVGLPGHWAFGAGGLAYLYMKHYGHPWSE